MALVAGHIVPAEPPEPKAALAKFHLLRRGPQSGEGGNPIRLFEVRPGEFVGLAAFQNGRVGASIFAITKDGAYRTLHRFPPYYAGYSLVQAADGTLFGDGGLSSGPDRQYSYFSVDAGPEHAVRVLPVASSTVPGVILGNSPDGSFDGLVTSGYQKYSLVAIDKNGAIRTTHAFAENEGIPYRGESLARNRSGEFTGLAISSPSGTRKAWIYRIDNRGRYRRLADVEQFEGSRSAPVFVDDDDVTYIGIPLGGRNKTGSIVRVSPDDKVTTLVEFPPGNLELARPAFFMEASDGRLYGSNSSQPSSIFRVDRSSGKLDLVYAFEPDGSEGTCICRFVQGSDGSFYGIAAAGGPPGTGAMFRLDAGLPAPKRR